MFQVILRSWACPSYLKTMWKVLENFHFLYKTFFLQGPTTFCQGPVMPEKWRMLTFLGNSPHRMWTFHWLSLKIPSSPLSSFFFFHHPTKSCPACGESHIHSQGSKQRTPRSPNTCVAPGSHNAHRGHLTCTNACDIGCVRAIVEKKKNEASLREVEAIP